MTKPQNDFLVLFATTSQEKIVEFNAIARLKNLPMVFVNFREIMGFHTTEEDKGDRTEHAREKSQEIDGRVDLLIHSADHNQALQKLCAQYGIPYDLRRIISVSEDTSLSLDSSTWNAVSAQIAKYLPEDIMEKAELGAAIYDGLLHSGPNSEYGPIVSAIGTERFFSIAKDVVTKTTTVGTSMLTSTLVARRFSDSATAPKIEISASISRNLLKQPKSADIASARWITTAEHRLGLPDNGENPIAECYEKYLRDYSPRAHIAIQLYKKLAASIRPSKSQDFQNAATSITSASPKPFVGYVACSGKPMHLNAISSKPRIFAANENTNNPYLKTLDISRSLSNGDAFILTPYNPMNAAESRRRMFLFFSALVEKSIETASANKSIIVTSDGCYDPAIQLYLHLINSGMAKDFDLVPELEASAASDAYNVLKNPKIGCKHFGLFDLLYTIRSKDNAALLASATDALLLKRRAEYTPSVAHLPKQKTGKTNPDTEYNNHLFKIAIFTTASSDNVIVSNIARHICGNIAEMNWKGPKGTGVVWGAGDRHGMGAVHEACTKNGVYLEGYSTHPILVMESKYGSMPSCDYSEISPNIFHRMAKMIEASDVISILPGGFGTIQELLAVLMLMDARPDLMKNKSVIIHNQDINGTGAFMGPVIDAVLGKDALKALQQDHAALSRQRIYMATTPEEHVQLIQDIKSNSAKKHESRRQIISSSGISAHL